MSAASKNSRIDGSQTAPSSAASTGQISSNRKRTLSTIQADTSESVLSSTTTAATSRTMRRRLNSETESAQMLLNRVPLTNATDATERTTTVVQNTLPPSSATGRASNSATTFSATPPSLHRDITTLDRYNYEDNFKCICDFPRDKGAQIKSINKKLTLVDWVTWVAWSTGQIHLSDTVPELATTVRIAFHDFKQIYNTLSWAQGSNDAKVKVLKQLAAQITSQMALYQGLLNIHCVYGYRYRHKDHSGLIELNILCNYAVERLSEQVQAYQEVAEGFRSRQDVHQFTPEIRPPLATLTHAATTITGFCQLYCPDANEADMRHKIQLGQTLVQRILDTTLRNAPLRGSESVAEITWFLMYCALRKGQAFEEGTFVIEDGLKLYQALHALPSAGDRTSSHFISRSQKCTSSYLPSFLQYSYHRGLDAVDVSMPCRKRTVLFAPVEVYKQSSPYLFFKPENYSTFITSSNGWDAFFHAGEFLYTQGTKWSPGSDDLPGMQKEHIPDGVKLAFKALLEYAEANQIVFNRLPLDLNNASSESLKWGVAYMEDFVSSIERGIPNLSLECRQLVVSYKNTLDALVPNDNRSLRTGREVFLSSSELQKFVTEPISI